LDNIVVVTAVIVVINEKAKQSKRRKKGACFQSLYAPNLHQNKSSSEVHYMISRPWVKFYHHHHQHHHLRISSRRKSWTKLQGRFMVRLRKLNTGAWFIPHQRQSVFSSQSSDAKQ